MTCSSDRADTWASSRYSRCSGSSRVCSTRSVMPSTPFIGVRISWLMLATNSLLAWLVVSAALASSCVRCIAPSSRRLAAANSSLTSPRRVCAVSISDSWVRMAPVCERTRRRSSSTQPTPAASADTSAAETAASRAGVNGDGVLTTARSSAARMRTAKPEVISAVSVSSWQMPVTRTRLPSARSSNETPGGATARNVVRRSSSVSTVRSRVVERLITTPSICTSSAS